MREREGERSKNGGRSPKSFAEKKHASDLSPTIAREHLHRPGGASGVTRASGGTVDVTRARQQFAWGCVKDWTKETATRIQGLPVQLRAQGLSTTVAVLLREDRPESRALLRLLAEWLLGASPVRTLFPHTLNAGPPELDGQTLLASCLALELEQQDTYLAAQDDALALLAEAKLLASARFPTEVYRA